MSTLAAARDDERINLRPIILGVCFLWGLVLGVCFYLFREPAAPIGPQVKDIGRDQPTAPVAANPIRAAPVVETGPRVEVPKGPDAFIPTGEETVGLLDEVPRPSPIALDPRWGLNAASTKRPRLPTAPVPNPGTAAAPVRAPPVPDSPTLLDEPELD